MEHEALPFQKLDAYRVARELAKVVHESKIRDPELLDRRLGPARAAFCSSARGCRATASRCGGSSSRARTAACTRPWEPWISRGRLAR